MIYLICSRINATLVIKPGSNHWNRSTTFFISLSFLSLFAAISAGIGLVNLFPIPILDGGHLIMLLYEFAFKMPPPDYLVKFLMTVGFFILFALMIFATFNDIVR